MLSKDNSGTSFPAPKWEEATLRLFTGIREVQYHLNCKRLLAGKKTVGVAL
jgi:hypothetical protein